MRQRYLHSVAYRLGEIRSHISEMAGHKMLLKSAGIPLMPELGLGYFHETRDIYQLVKDSVAETVLRSGIAAQNIDHVIVCSSHFSEPFDFRNRGLAVALTSNCISPRRLRGVCGVGCADVLCGLEIAAEMLDSASAKNVLVVGSEALHKDEPSARILDYAIISDAVATFIVSNSPGSSVNSLPYRILSQESMSMLSMIGKGMRVSDAKSYVLAVKSALVNAGVSLASVRKVFSSNTFRLVKKNREIAAGFSERQMYLENIERIGHCLACDPIINLVDYCGGADGSNYVLFAEAEGHSSAVVLADCVSFP